MSAARYCHPEPFFDVTTTQFGNLMGGPLIAAMAEWIKANLAYDIAASDASTDAFAIGRVMAGAVKMSRGPCWTACLVLVFVGEEGALDIGFFAIVVEFD